MNDERDEAEKSLDVLGTAPGGHATFEEPTGADAVVAREPATITDGGVVPPDDDPDQPEQSQDPTEDKELD